MKKALATFLIPALLWAFVINPAQGASPKLGSSCLKIGATLNVAGQKYLCAKSGKKLLWIKNTRVASTTPTPAPTPAQSPAPVLSSTPSPTATPMPTPTPKVTKTPFKALIPIPLPVPQNKAITFANAVTQFSLIPQTAWQNVQDVINANPAVNIPTTIVIGPNTDTTEDQIISALQKEYRIWSGFQQPPSYAGLFYNAKDEAWAETEWPKMAARLNLTDHPEGYIPNHLRAGCGFSNNVATECWGGMAVVFQNTNAGFAFYGVQSPFWSANSFQAGPFSQVTHEYTHNVQFAQWIGSDLKAGEGNRAGSAHNGSPCWFSEGQANGIGIPVASTSLNTYFEGRDNSIRRKINTNVSVAPVLSDNGLTADAISSFLYNQNIATCYNPNTNGDWQLGYNIGFAATEVLIAVGGPQSTMALLAETASGMTWAEAFQAVYGVSWKEGSDILGKVLAAEYAAKPMNH